MIDPKKYQPQTSPKRCDFVTFDVVSLQHSFEKITDVPHYEKLAALLESLLDDFSPSLAKSYATRVWSVGGGSEVFTVDSSSQIVVVAYKHEDDYKKATRELQLERKEGHERFYRDCCEWIGAHAERQVNRKIFDKAWDDRHGEGYDAVFDEFDELHDFFIDALYLIEVDYEF